MINPAKSGYLVRTKTGKLGRTIHEKGLVNGKVPVYLVTESKICEEGTPKEFEFPVKFSETAMLCDPAGLKHVGFID